MNEGAGGSAGTLSAEDERLCANLRLAAARIEALSAEVAALEKERDALLSAAEHGLSLMLGSSESDPTLRLYHRCDGCEAALRLLQARGIYLNASTTGAEGEKP